MRTDVRYAVVSEGGGIATGEMRLVRTDVNAFIGREERGIFINSEDAADIALSIRCVVGAGGEDSYASDHDEEKLIKLAEMLESLKA